MKYLTALLISLAAVQVNAQTGQGSWMIGGSMQIRRASFAYGTFDQVLGVVITGSSTTANFSASPTVGYFFANNLMIGLQPSYSYSWAPNVDYYNQQTVGIGPIARYYLPFGKFAVFPELAYSYGSAKIKTFQIDHVANDKMKSNSYRAGIGGAWFVAPNIGIEGIFAYQNVDVSKTEWGDTKYLYINFGIQFYLPKND